MRMFNMYKSHFRIHWKLIILLTLIWFIVTISIFSILFIAPVFSIADGTLMQYTVEPNHGNIGSSISSPSVGILYNIFYKSFGIVFYGFASIIFINKILLKEINSTQISIWLTQPFSKSQIIIIKYFFLLTFLSILYWPAFIVVIAFSSSASDAKELLSNIVLGGFQIYIFLIMLSLIFFTISLLLIERIIIFNVIGSLILCYFLLITMLELIALISGMNNQVLDFVIKYLGLQVFITDILPYDLDAENISNIVSEKINEDGKKIKLVLETIVVKNINKIAYSLLTVSMIGISTGLGYVSTVLFKSKSLNI